MTKRPVQHSYSALTLAETCLKKYYHERIKKDYKGTTSSVGDYGLEAHKAFEKRLINKKPLPMDLRHHEKILKKLDDAPGVGLPEQKLAINKDFEPTGFFDSDVWLRAVIDYVKTNNSVAMIVDHKFGRMKHDFDQVSLCAAVFSCYEPDINKYVVAYYWAKEKTLMPKRIQKEEIPVVWEKFLPRFKRLEMAVENQEFPAKPNYLCKKYCSVRSCQYHGS